MAAEQSHDVLVLEALVMIDFALDFLFFLGVVFLVVDFDLISEQF